MKNIILDAYIVGYKTSFAYLPLECNQYVSISFSSTSVPRLNTCFLNFGLSSICYYKKNQLCIQLFVEWKLFLCMSFKDKSNISTTKT